MEKLTRLIEKMQTALIGPLTGALSPHGIGGRNSAELAVKLITQRPRPAPDLVHVFRLLSGYSFPSGHVLLFTAFLGFLFFLVYTLTPGSWVRTGGLLALGALIALVGLSRVYLGQHWPSDVLAGVLLGALWQQVAMRIYLWGEARRRPGVMARPLRTLGRGRGAGRARVHSVSATRRARTLGAPPRSGRA